MKPEEVIQRKIVELNEQVVFLNQEKINYPEQANYYIGLIHDLFLQIGLLWWVIDDEYVY